VLQALRDLALARQDFVREADFQKAMAAGQKAMAAKNYKEAVQAYQAATKLKPGDAQVSSLLESALRELRRSTDLPKTKEEPKKTTADPQQFQQLLAAGQKALQAKK